MAPRKRTTPKEERPKTSRRRQQAGVKESAAPPADAPAASDSGADHKSPFKDIEERFHESLERPIEEARRIGKADIVIGIPFYNEVDTIAHVIQIAIMGLEEYYPTQRCVIVAAGSPVGGKALAVINSLPRHHRIERIAFTFGDSRISGKGWSVRAIAEIARMLNADHAILEADLRSREKDGEMQGLAPDWIYLLLEPIRLGKADVVISRFNRHYLEFGPNLLTYPLLTAIYNRPIHRVVGGQWAIAHWILPNYLRVPLHLWGTDISGYGVDGWTGIAGIAGGARIVEADLGIKIHQPSIAKREMVLRQVAKVLLDQIVTDTSWLNEMEKTPSTPLLTPLPVFGARREHRADPVDLFPDQLIAKFKEGFNTFHALYQKVLPEDAYRLLEQLSETDVDNFLFPTSLWIDVVYNFLLAYAFGKEYSRGDLLNALIYLHGAFLASFSMGMERLKDRLSSLLSDETERLLTLEAQKRFEDLGTDFLLKRAAFLKSWEMTSESLKPPVPQITYREFIPGVPLVVPTEITTPDGRVVTANGIYDTVFARQKTQFERFVYNYLKVPRQASSLEITLAIKDFLASVEERLFPDADLCTMEGTTKLVKAVFRLLPHEDAFSLTPEIASRLLAMYPPLTLLTKKGFSSVAEMLKVYSPCDVLALASWTEEREWTQGLWKLISEDLRPEHFAPCPITPIVVSHDDFPALVEMKDSSALNKLTSRIVVASLHKGMGGEFPKLRYVSTLAKNIVEAEKFGRIWRRFAEDGGGFARKVVNSMEGHWGREPLSAHAIFEDGVQRTVVERVKKMTERMIAEARNEAIRTLAEHIRALVEAYHLALMLPDGKFVTCSAWSWASYSFKGGRASPSPLSLHVERDWASREFLLEYYKAIGGSEEAMEEKIIELMGQGRESDDLAAILLGTEKGREKVVPLKPVIIEQPRAGSLTRYSGNPVLQPIKNHAWESKYVLNAGAIRLDGKVYLVYRAFGDDEVSRLGLAISRDGFRFTQRLDKPIFEPANSNETKGCEDPRLVLMGGRIFMTYTAYDGTVAQIALASITKEDFVNFQWDRWERHGLVFPGYTDKDAAMFPAQFNGKFAMLHRVDPHIWITFSDHLSCPWPRQEHKILAGATAGMMWDGLKIGAGAQPIRTRYGWLLITHGVDYARVYRLGVMLLDLHDPTKLIYRSPNFILEPETASEVGKEGECWVRNVVFTCGALPLYDTREELGAEDELIVYYGASDTVISVAIGKVGDLIPAQFRV